MIRCLVCILIIFGTCFSSFAKERRNKRIDSLMSQLDSVISARPRYLAIKEKHLAQLKEELATAVDDKRRFDIIGWIVDSYASFNTDSAYRYSELREAVADEIGDRELIVNARMNQADILSSIGMYTEAMELMEPITSAGLPDSPYFDVHSAGAFTPCHPTFAFMLDNARTGMTVTIPIFHSHC